MPSAVSAMNQHYPLGNHCRRTEQSTDISINLGISFDYLQRYRVVKVQKNIFAEIKVIVNFSPCYPWQAWPALSLNNGKEQHRAV